MRLSIPHDDGLARVLVARAVGRCSAQQTVSRFEQCRTTSSPSLEVLFVSRSGLTGGEQSPVSGHLLRVRKSGDHVLEGHFPESGELIDDNTALVADDLDPDGDDLDVDVEEDQGFLRTSKSAPALDHAFRIKRPRFDSSQHALRIKRPRFDSSQHALRIKRPRFDSSQHALRIKRGNGMMFNHVFRTKKGNHLGYGSGEPYIKRELFRSHILRAI